MEIEKLIGIAAKEARLQVLGSQEEILRRVASRASKLLQGAGVDVNENPDIAKMFVDTLVETNKDLFPQAYKNLQRRKSRRKQGAKK